MLPSTYTTNKFTQGTTGERLVTVTLWPNRKVRLLLGARLEKRKPYRWINGFLGIGEEKAGSSCDISSIYFVCYIRCVPYYLYCNSAKWYCKQIINFMHILPKTIKLLKGAKRENAIGQSETVLNIVSSLGTNLKIVHLLFQLYWIT